MLTVRLPYALEKSLNHLSQKTGRKKSEYMIRALEKYFCTHKNKLDQALTLMEKKPGLSFDEARKRIDFWNNDLEIQEEK